MQISLAAESPEARYSASTHRQKAIAFINRGCRRCRTIMSVKILVREDESIEQAVRRFKSQVIRERAIETRWPTYTGRYFKPSLVRHRQEWIRSSRTKAGLKSLRRRGITDWCGQWSRQLKRQ